MSNRSAASVAMTLLLGLAVGGCDVFGPDLGLGFYSIRDVNGHACTTDSKQRMTCESEIILGSVPYEDTTCTIRFDGSFVSLDTKEREYSVFLNASPRCEGVDLHPMAELVGYEKGTYTARNGTLAFKPTERKGLILNTGTLRGDRITIEGGIDASDLHVSNTPGFGADTVFPIRMEYVKTAED